MSVEYSSGIAEGWLFTQEEVDDFNKKTNYKYEDDFILIDSWTGDSDSIFGEWVMHNTEEGAAKPIERSIFTGRLNLTTWIDKFHEAGFEKVSPPQTFLVNQVH